MRTLFLIILLQTVGLFAQTSWNDFTGEQRAFLFHVSRRTDNLKAEIFPLFQYTDSIPWINDTLADWKYVEKQIVNSPEVLILHTDEMARKSIGLVADLATKYALWELDAVLHYRNSEADEHKPLKVRLKQFEQYVLEDAPQTAVRTLSDGEYVLEKTLQGYYAPSLTIGDKKAAIKNTGFSINDQMLILNAIMKAQQKYVAIRSFEIFLALGGKIDSFSNYLSAVGDGDNWAEIESGYKTPYNRILPEDIALYAFNAEVKVLEETDQEYVGLSEVTKKPVVTSTDKNTVLHFDVAGYHPERQTTIVIQKGDRSYVLYGKNEHRLISPDSTYGEGQTYWRLMWMLEYVHIADLKERLYGKKGYEYWIDEYESRIENTLLLIKKTEYKLDQLRHQPNPPPKIKKKKLKKKNLGTSDQDGQGHPTGALTKLDKKKNVEQNRLIRLNTQLENEKRILQELKDEYEEAYNMLVKYETLLDKMRKNVGYALMEYEEENGFYTFRDGATFNYRTQDFVFAPGSHNESFQVFHISFGKDVFAKQIDENFVHMNLSYVSPEQTYILKKTVTELDNPKDFYIQDSIQTMELFRILMEKKVKAELSLVAGGILGGIEAPYYRDSTMMPSNYSADNTNERKAIEYYAEVNANVNMRITYWRNDMLPVDYSMYESGFQKIHSKNAAINRIDYITAVVVQQKAEEWKAALILKAENWLEDGKEKNLVLKKLKKLNTKKVKFLNGQYTVGV